MNIFIQIEAKPVKNASSFLLFGGHSELKTGLLSRSVIMSINRP